MLGSSLLRCCGTNYDLKIVSICFIALSTNCLDSIVDPLRHKAFLRVAEILIFAQGRSLTAFALQFVRYMIPMGHEASFRYLPALPRRSDADRWCGLGGRRSGPRSPGAKAYVVSRRNGCQRNLLRGPLRSAGYRAAHFGD